jgi:hypothetical protein
MMFVLNGVLPAPVRDDGHVTPAGPIQSLFVENERETALAIAGEWYAKGWKPLLFSKTYNGQFETMFNYKYKDRGAKASATRKAKRLAA